MIVLCELRWNSFEMYPAKNEAYLVLERDWSSRLGRHRGVRVLKEGREYCTKWLTSCITKDPVLALPEEWVEDGT